MSDCSEEEDKPARPSAKENRKRSSSLSSATSTWKEFASKSSRHKCPEVCAVCGRKSNGYHYEAPTCCGCKAFFRRLVLSQMSYTCDREGNCVITAENRMFCRACRFEKCVAVGMNPQGIRSAENLENNVLVKLISERKSSGSSSQSPCRKLSLEETERLVEDLLNFEFEKEGRSEGVSVDRWSERTTPGKFLSERHFLQLFPFLKRLDQRDQDILVDNGLLLLYNLTQAYNQVERRKADSQEAAATKSNPLGEKTERQLMDPIERSDTNRKEFVLLKALVLCNTCLDGLSDDAISVLEEEKQKFGSALLHHCLSADEINGPARFVSNLSIINSLEGVTAQQRNLLLLIRIGLNEEDEGDKLSEYLNV